MDSVNTTPSIEDLYREYKSSYSSANSLFDTWLFNKGYMSLPVYKGLDTDTLKEDTPQIPRLAFVEKENGDMRNLELLAAGCIKHNGNWYALYSNELGIERMTVIKSSDVPSSLAIVLIDELQEQIYRYGEAIKSSVRDSSDEDPKRVNISMPPYGEDAKDWLNVKLNINRRDSPIIYQLSVSGITPENLKIRQIIVDYDLFKLFEDYARHYAKSHGYKPYEHAEDKVILKKETIQAIMIIFNQLEMGYSFSEVHLKSTVKALFSETNIRPENWGSTISETYNYPQTISKDLNKPNEWVLELNQLLSTNKLLADWDLLTKQDLFDSIITLVNKNFGTPPWKDQIPQKETYYNINRIATKVDNLIREFFNKGWAAENKVHTLAPKVYNFILSLKNDPEVVGGEDINNRLAIIPANSMILNKKVFMYLMPQILGVIDKYVGFTANESNSFGAALYETIEKYIYSYEIKNIDSISTLADLEDIPEPDATEIKLTKVYIKNNLTKFNSSDVDEFDTDDLIAALIDYHHWRIEGSKPAIRVNTYFEGKLLIEDVFKAGTDLGADRLVDIKSGIVPKHSVNVPMLDIEAAVEFLIKTWHANRRSYNSNTLEAAGFWKSSYDDYKKIPDDFTEFLKDANLLK